MTSTTKNYLLCLAFFSLLAAVSFRCVWPVDQVFSASDLNIGRLAAIKSSLPEGLIGLFYTNQLLGGTGVALSLFNVLMTISPLIFFANVFYGAMLVFSSFALIWFLQMWQRSWAASVFGALVAFWFNVTMLAVGGHAYKIEVLAFSVLALGLIEKSVRAERSGRAVGWALLAGLAVGITMVEQQDVALLSGLFTGSYTVFRLVILHGKKPLRWLAVLLPIGLVALLLSGTTALGAYRHNVINATVVQGDPVEKWNFITQWSMVPSEWPDLVATGWSGWASNDPRGPYWGEIGQSAEWSVQGQGFRNFKLTSVYIGIIPLLLGIYGSVVAFRNRKTADGKIMLFWSIAGVVALWLAFGKFSPLYKLFYHLPLVGNIRAPIKLLDNFTICLGIISAYGLDQILVAGRKEKSVRILWMVASACAGLMVLAGLKQLLFPATRLAEFAQMGFAPYAETMVSTMARAWLHGGVLALICAVLVFFVWKGLNVAKWLIPLFIAVVAVDNLLLTTRYFNSTDISALKKGNVVVNYIKEHQGNESTFLMDQGGIYNQWLAADGPYHGLNLFNIWQMPRMPDDYKEFLGTVGRNQIRLWELSAVKYVAAPSEILQQLTQNPQLAQQFQPVLNYQVPTAQGMRNDVLLEFKGTIPRFALFQGWESVAPTNQCQLLASPQHNPRSTVLLDPAFNLGTQTATVNFLPLEAQTTKRKATLRVNASTDSIVRFSQYFQPGWTVRVDGKPVELLRVDYLCMGVAVPPGEHVVEFRCIDGTSQAGFMLGVFLLSAGAAVWLLRTGGGDKKQDNYLRK